VSVQVLMILMLVN